MERMEMNAEEAKDKNQISESDVENAELPDKNEQTQSNDEIEGETAVADNENEQTDYEALERADMAELSSIFPELRGKSRVSELNNPLRYAALRDLGLTPKEAYLATSEPRRAYDTRSHLVSSVPGGATAPQDTLSKNELDAARELFSGLSDREIQKLYKKVSK